MLPGEVPFGDEFGPCQAWRLESRLNTRRGAAREDEAQEEARTNRFCWGFYFESCGGDCEFTKRRICLKWLTSRSPLVTNTNSSRTAWMMVIAAAAKLPMTHMTHRMPVRKLSDVLFWSPGKLSDIRPGPQRILLWSPSHPSSRAAPAPAPARAISHSDTLNHSRLCKITEIPP